MRFPVEFEVLSHNETTGNKVLEYGVTICETYTEAMNYIENYYRDDLITAKLHMLEENDLYIFNEDTFDTHKIIKKATITT